MSDGLPDQSMEDILASIKRVISADAADAATRRRAAPVESVADVPSPDAPASDAPALDEDVLELGAAPAHGPTRPGAEILLSGASVEASKAALAQLATIRLDPRADEHTLDGLVREMLRPMLKAWLDANLPDLVERVVTREVARVVGR